MTDLLFDAEAKALLLPLDGCHNFRAVAGWRARDGKRIVPGLLFRSDRLDQLTAADQARIAELDIDQVFDLRASAEIGRAITLADGRHAANLERCGIRCRGRP